MTNGTANSNSVLDAMNWNTTYINRFQYAMTQLLLFVLLVFAMASAGNDPILINVASIIFLLLSAYISVKRLRSLGRTGWWVLLPLLFVPIVSFLFILILCIVSDKKDKEDSTLVLETVAYTLGRKAFSAGQSLLSNPYTTLNHEGRRLHDEWNKGFDYQDAHMSLTKKPS